MLLADNANADPDGSWKLIQRRLRNSVLRCQNSVMCTSTMHSARHTEHTGWSVVISSIICYKWFVLHVIFVIIFKTNYQKQLDNARCW